MAKAPREMCVATTAKGTPCTNKAWPGSDRCKTHDKTLSNKSTKQSKTSARAIGGVSDEDFHPHLREILNLCRGQIADPHEKSGTLAVWARIQLDAVRHAIEHQRLLDGIGAGVQYVCHTFPPGDKPPPPVDDDEPERAIEGDVKGMSN